MMMTSSSSSKVGGVNGGYVEMERQDQNKHDLDDTDDVLKSSLVLLLFFLFF